MTIGPNEDGAELYREHLESLPCALCGTRESDFKALLLEVKQLKILLKSSGGGREAVEQIIEDNKRLRGDLCLLLDYFQINEKFITQLRREREKG